MSPYVGISLLSVTHGQCDARLTITFPACAGTKLILLDNRGTCACCPELHSTTWCPGSPPDRETRILTAQPPSHTFHCEMTILIRKFLFVCCSTITTSLSRIFSETQHAKELTNFVPKSSHIGSPYMTHHYFSLNRATIPYHSHGGGGDPRW